MIRYIPEQYYIETNDESRMFYEGELYNKGNEPYYEFTNHIDKAFLYNYEDEAVEMANFLARAPDIGTRVVEISFRPQFRRVTEFK